MTNLCGRTKTGWGCRSCESQPHDCGPCDCSHAPCVHDLNTARTERDRFKLALDKIDKIRDSIIGKQGFNWSEHAYPLVAALKEAGYEGAGYEIARENLGTLIEQTKAAEADRDQWRLRYNDLAQERARLLVNLQLFCPHTVSIDTSPSFCATCGKETG